MVQFNSRSEARNHARSANHDAQRQFIKMQRCIVNKTFVEMLDKLGYDIQITYVKKETN